MNKIEKQKKSETLLLQEEADLARQREPQLTTARAGQIPKYDRIRAESRLFPAMIKSSKTSVPF